MSELTIEVAGRTLTVSRPDKVLIPDVGLTKQDLVEHYAAVAEVMTPHLDARAAVLRRFPDGIEATGFFQKAASEHFPDWLPTARLERLGDGTVEHVVVSDASALCYLADQAMIELHIWPSRVDRPHHPDQLLFDVDPPGEDTDAARWAARALGDLLRQLEVEALLKTSGSKGYHVHVPLDRTASFDEVRPVARDVADRLVARHPDRLTTTQRKNRRGRRVFLDVARNAYAQHAVAPYSVRALPGAPVATPLDWTELARTAPRRFTTRNVRRRLDQKADPWVDAFDDGIALTDLRRRLDELG